MDKWINGINGWMHDGRMDGRKDGWMEGCIGGRTDRQIKSK